MIEKIENPLNFGIEQVDAAIAELQKTFDDFNRNPGVFEVDESNVCLELTTRKETYSYSLDQLKKLKAQLSDPLVQSLGEMA